MPPPAPSGNPARQPFGYSAPAGFARGRAATAREAPCHMSAGFEVGREAPVARGRGPTSSHSGRQKPASP